MRARFNAIKTALFPDGSELLDQVIGYIREAFERLGDVVTNNGLVPITLQPGVETIVPHGLKTRITGFEVVRQDQPAIVYESSKSPNPTVYVLLTAANTVNPVALLIRFS